jgi:hypothetical protein
LRIGVIRHVRIHRKGRVEAVITNPFIEEYLDEPRFPYAGETHESDNASWFPKLVTHLLDTLQC